MQLVGSAELILPVSMNAAHVGDLAMQNAHHLLQVDVVSIYLAMSAPYSRVLYCVTGGKADN